MPPNSDSQHNQNFNAHPVYQGPTSPAPDAYNFLLNPEKPHKSPFSLPPIKAHSVVGRIAVVVGGLFVLIIAFLVLSSLLKSPSDVPALTAVAQDQVELTHIAANASNEPDISTANQTFVATAQACLTSSTSQLNSLLSASGHSLSQGTLSLKVSSLTDQNLSSAETNGDFNQQFIDTANNQLNSYLGDLSFAYKQANSSVVRALLKSDYKQAKLLLTQLSSLNDT